MVKQENKTQAISKFQATENALKKYTPKIQQVLPKGVNGVNFVSKVMSSIRKNPGLMNASIESLAGAVIECATLDLVPDGITGLAHLVPFKNKGNTECQLIIGYKGIRKLVLRNPEYKKFVMRAVYEGDDFSYEFGIDEHLKHVPKSKSNKLTHVYAFVKTADEDIIFDVMTKEEVDTVMKKTQKGDKINPVWIKYYDSMAQKTVANRLANKQLDLVTEAQRAFANDDMAMQGELQGNHTNVNIEDDNTFFDEFEEVKEQDTAIANQEVERKSSKAEGKAMDELGISVNDDDEGF